MKFAALSPWACSVCFGDPSSPLRKGLFAGVLFLLLVVLTVLAAIAWTGFSWQRRAKAGGKGPF
ncbi:MAG: hypothetical protein HYT89_02785 [Candidatus Omnitrophica bacterium]|nr:hypothetical protein [Candidatus Omnitrophota bacterium]